MASKKQDFNMTGQGLTFISSAHPEEKAPEQEPAVTEVTQYTDSITAVSMSDGTTRIINKGGRPKSRGETRRASVFLDADLEVALKIQAAIERKSVSVMISDVMRQYLKDKGRFEDMEK